MNRKLLSVFWAFLFLHIGTAMAQSKITGTVISAEDDEPIIGATVSVTGRRHKHHCYLRGHGRPNRKG